MLCIMLGVRWAVGTWERAKKRWWEDWVRVGEGLGRDLEVSSTWFSSQTRSGVHFGDLFCCYTSGYA